MLSSVSKLSPLHPLLTRRPCCRHDDRFWAQNVSGCGPDLPSDICSTQAAALRQLCNVTYLFIVCITHLLARLRPRPGVLAWDQCSLGSPDCPYDLQDATLPPALFLKPKRVNAFAFLQTFPLLVLHLYINLNCIF